MTLQALIFDVDGTLADTGRAHLPASGWVAFEDSANGLASAHEAGPATVIAPNEFTAHHDFRGALRVLPNLSGLSLAQLRQWHADARQGTPAHA